MDQFLKSLVKGTSFAVIAFFVFSLFSPTVSAQSLFFPEGLVPCGFVENSGQPEACVRECNMCGFIKLTQNILNFLVYGTALLATLMIAYYAILLMTSAPNQEHIDKVRGMWKQLLKGAFYILIAWLAVDVIFKVFYNGELGPWNEILCEGENTLLCTSIDFQPSVIGPDTGVVINPLPGPPVVQPIVPPGLQPDQGVGHTQAVLGLGAQIDATCDPAVVTATNICITSSNQEAGVRNTCADANGNQLTGCTTLDGIQSDTVDYVKTLADDCEILGCRVIITGASECSTVHGSGTFSHCNGYKVDLRNTDPGLNQYMQNEFINNPNAIQDTTGAGPRYTVQQPDGSFVRVIVENNHYDVQVLPQGTTF